MTFNKSTDLENEKFDICVDNFESLNPFFAFDYRHTDPFSEQQQLRRRWVMLFQFTHAFVNEPLPHTKAELNRTHDALKTDWQRYADIATQPFLSIWNVAISNRLNYYQMLAPWLARVDLKAHQPR